MNEEKYLKLYKQISSTRKVNQLDNYVTRDVVNAKEVYLGWRDPRNVLKTLHQLECVNFPIKGQCAIDLLEET